LVYFQKRHSIDRESFQGVVHVFDLKTQKQLHGGVLKTQEIDWNNSEIDILLLTGFIELGINTGF